ncbi:uncharacterized protein LOC135161349 [Diachasmimorpha longicaudata]|uniref:uncharacterized protein LOC135161349 n=1 Tax=Diachasmimorpha longicaudata TaxID=58733 RepID=UPI0030B8B9C4
MATEKFEFDTTAMHALNANLKDRIDQKTATSLRQKSLSPERGLLVCAAEEFEAGNYRAAASHYEAYLSTRQEHPVYTNKHFRLDVLAQYLFCKCLLQSNQLTELKKIRSILEDLESSVGNVYPMIYLGLVQFYIKTFNFDEANRMATKGLSVAEKSDAPWYTLPASMTVIPESKIPELRKELVSLMQECSAWHKPDTKCFMTICRSTSENHIHGRNIFLDAPGYNGMVTLTCNNTKYPCKIHFHTACWKAKKDEASSVAKISDKDIFNWKCFTPDCGTTEHPSHIIKITIHKEDGSVKEIEAPADKSQRHVPQTALASKGATRKQKQLIKATSRSSKVKGLSTERQIAVPGKRRGKPCVMNLCPVVPRIAKASESLMTSTDDPIGPKVMEMISLRELNFYVDPDNDWRPSRAYYGNEHMRSTIDTSYGPDFLGDDDHRNSVKDFLFSYFLSYIKNSGPIKNEELIREWRSLAEYSDLKLIVNDFNGITDVRNFLLQSLKFVAVGNYICIPALLPGAYALAGEETELRVMEMMEKKTIDLSSGHLKRRKNMEVKKKAESCNQGVIKTETVEGGDDPVENDKLLVNVDDCLHEMMEETDEDDCSIAAESVNSSDGNMSFQTPVKRMKIEEVEENVGFEATKDLEEMKGEPVKEEDENESDEMVKRMDDSDKEEMSEQISGGVQGSSKMPEVITKLQTDEVKEGKNVETTDQEEDKEVHERCIVEAESEGTLDDQDDLPWDGKPQVSIKDADTRNKHTNCRCEKLSDQEARMKYLEEKVQWYEAELRRCDAKLRMNADEQLDSNEKLQMTEEKLHETGDKLQKSYGELETMKMKLKETEDMLMSTRDNVDSIQKDLKIKQEMHTEMMRQMSKKVQDYEFNYNLNLITCKIDIIQSQYATIAKLNHFVYQITNNYLNVQWTEWSDLLAKLERMRSDLENEHRNLTTSMKSNSSSEEEELAFRTYMNSINLPPLPQRNIHDFMELAGKMLTNHYQQLTINYGRAVGPGFTAGSPLFPVWYQTPPRFPPQSPLLPHIAQVPLPGYTAPPYMGPIFPRDATTYGGTPLIMTDAIPNQSATPPLAQMFNDHRKNTKVTTGNLESVSSDDNSKKRDESRSENADGPEAEAVDVKEQLNGHHMTGTQDVKPQMVPSFPVATATTKEPPKINFPTAPQPMINTPQLISKAPVQDHVQTSALKPQEPFSASVSASAVKSPEEMKSVLVMPSVPSTSSQPPASTFNVALRVPVEIDRAVPTRPMKPEDSASKFISSVVLASSSPVKKTSQADAVYKQMQPLSPVPKVRVSQSMPVAPSVKERLKRLDLQAAKVSPAPALHQPLTKAKLSDPSLPPLHPLSIHQTEVSTNDVPVNGATVVMKRKMQSKDKLLQILRNKHPGVLEYDLLWSIEIVRQKHNHSLTGLPMVQIIAEADKLIHSRQKLQLLSYTSSNKTTYVKNQGIYVTVHPERLRNDSTSSTPSVSSFHREPVAKKNPWGQPQNVSWTKEFPEVDCVICWETLTSEGTKPMYTLKCQHTFHKTCLITWFKQNRSCPTCRIHSTIDDDFPPLP